jgi:hypothetical protein
MIVSTFLKQRLALVALVALVVAGARVAIGSDGLLLPTLAPAAGSPPAFVAATESNPEDLIQQVITQANDEQVQAIAQRDPSRMADTATDDHYQEMVQTNQSLLDHGVASIQLVKLDWGSIDVQADKATATATTFETWRTSFTDGTTDLSRDRNVYHLVLTDSGWKISADEHPDSDADASVGPAPQAPSPPVGEVVPTQNTSRNWAGYAAAGTFTSVTGTWTVPELPLDGGPGADATWVGIGGLRSRDLIQAGTQESSSGAGHVQYETWIEMLPDVAHPVPLVVRPGDSVTVSISQQAPGQWQFSFLNNTTGQTYERTASYTSSLSSAEWIEEAPSAGRRGVLPLDQFGSVSFSNASAVTDTGQTVSIADTSARPITMIDSQRRPLAVPSNLDDDGSSFTVTRTAVAASTASPLRRFGR